MEGRFAVVDIETSGLSAKRHRILQIGVVTLDGDLVVDEWETLVRLRWWQRVGPRRVHGISRRDLRRAPELAAAVTELATRLEGCVVVAHNIGFDWHFLRRAAERTGVALPDAPRLCTLQLSRSLDPERRLVHGLGAVAERYGIVNERPHNALADAITTAKLLPLLLAAVGVTSQPEALDLAAAQRAAALARRTAA